MRMNINVILSWGKYGKQHINILSNLSYGNIMVLTTSEKFIFTTDPLTHLTQFLSPYIKGLDFFNPPPSIMGAWLLLTSHHL